MVWCLWRIKNRALGIRGIREATNHTKRTQTKVYQNRFYRLSFRLATLLHKFRIEYASMNIITDIGKRPQPER